jgi:hypothetical protein
VPIIGGVAGALACCVIVLVVVVVYLVVSRGRNNAGESDSTLSISRVAPASNYANLRGVDEFKSQNSFKSATNYGSIGGSVSMAEGWYY